MELNNNQLSKYSPYNIIYDNSIVIHKQLFSKAIEKYCFDNNINKNDFKIIDKENNENILKPSTAIFINNNELKYIDLTDYWDMTYYNNSYNKTNNINELLLDEYNKKYIDIEYIDYVNERVQFKNKFTNKKFYIKFNKLNKI